MDTRARVSATARMQGATAGAADLAVREEEATSDGKGSMRASSSMAWLDERREPTVTCTYEWCRRAERL